MYIQGAAIWHPRCGPGPGEKIPDENLITTTTPVDHQVIFCKKKVFFFATCILVNHIFSDFFLNFLHVGLLDFFLFVLKILMLICCVCVYPSIYIPNHLLA